MLKHLSSPNVLKWIVLLTIVYIPISGLPNSIKSIMTTQQIVRVGIYSNIYLLALRDLLVVLGFGLTLVHLSYRKYKFPTTGIFFLLAGWLLICFGREFSHSPLIAILGLRSFEYLFLFVTIYVVATNSRNFESYFFYCIVYLLLFEFLFATLQLYHMKPYEGITAFGSRTIGTFNNPNTLGGLMTLILTYFIFVSDRPMKTTIPLSAIAMFVCLTSGSRASIIASFAIIFLWVVSITKGWLRYLLGLSVGTGLVLVVFNISRMAGRTVPKLYDDPRVRIFMDQIRLSDPFAIWFGHGIGERSNFAFTIGSIFPDLLDLPPNWGLAESTIVSLIHQTGLIGLVLFYIVIINLLWPAGFTGLVMFITVFAIGISNIWMELYPFNLLFVTITALLVVKYRARLA